MVNSAFGSYLGSRWAAYVRLADDLRLLVHLPNLPDREGAWRPNGSVDVVPLPGAVMNLPV
jgi:hypothetical protein